MFRYRQSPPLCSPFFKNYFFEKNLIRSFTRIKNQPHTTFGSDYSMLESKKCWFSTEMPMGSEVEKIIDFFQLRPQIVSQVSSRVFKIKGWFIVQIEAENEFFKNQKFFTPLKSFLPPPVFFNDEVWSLWCKNEKKHLFFEQELALGYKKGMKNFSGG